MGENSSIQWCHHTLNPWIGCAKVSAACRSCYAEHETPVRVMRAQGRETWGPDAVRHETKEWARNLRRWNRQARAAGERRRVFCASLADVFEDHPALPEIRARLWPEIEAAKDVDVLLVTKRTENIKRMVPPHWLVTGAREGSVLGWPAHVWVGATVENQEQAERRIPHLLRVPARVRFLSCEPLLEAVDLDPPTCPTCGGHDAVEQDCVKFCREHGDEMAYGAWLDACASEKQPGISWVIIGGESGSKARPFDLAWARSLVRQCREAGVAPFVKQLGAVPLASEDEIRAWPQVNRLWSMRPNEQKYRIVLRDSHGGDPSEWPEDLRIREFPRGATP